LSDGHRVGYSVGGRGVPLVFLHGITMNRRIYLRLLSRVAALGFRVFAFDAAGHGDTSRMRNGVNTFTDRVELTARTMDRLGIRSAVIMGHSMGGRMAVELAASRPESVIAAVLLDAAAGDEFDLMAAQAMSWPPNAVLPLLRAVADTDADRRMVPPQDGSYFRRSVAVALGKSAIHPLDTVGTMRAIASSKSSRELLTLLRRNRTETIVVHGQDDQVVPWPSAVSTAEHADAALYRIPRARHSWMLSDPSLGVRVIRQLVDAELGRALGIAQNRLGIVQSQRSAWEEATLRDGAVNAP
jgi:pimeloyl-ACP methyl ester carboxylesterase